MSFLPIFRTLKENTEVMALIPVNDKGRPFIFEDLAPIDPETGKAISPPYIVWQIISGQANNHLDEPANFDDTQYQLMAYAATPKQAYDIRDACRKALEHLSWIKNPSIGHYETNTKLYARGFDANWILAR